MRSLDAGLRRLKLATTDLLLVGFVLSTTPAQAEDKIGITPQQVASAVDAVRKDPNLPGEKKTKTLRLKRDDEPRQPRRESGSRWLTDLVEWFAESARWMVWLAGAACVAMVLVQLRRWILARADALAPRGSAPPSHVHDLDIRPESLPHDIGAAARALWVAGQQRAALSLLYRGALSRLVHAHAVPIRAASTEAECVRIASRIMPPSASQFFARLVDAWEIAVYGAHPPQTAAVLALCDEFDTRLPDSSTAGQTP